MAVRRESRHIESRKGRSRAKFQPFQRLGDVQPFGKASAPKVSPLLLFTRDKCAK